VSEESYLRIMRIFLCIAEFSLPESHFRGHDHGGSRKANSALAAAFTGRLFSSSAGSVTRWDTTLSTFKSTSSTMLNVNAPRTASTMPSNTGRRKWLSWQPAYRRRSDVLSAT
jgi:hypothetical protein